jgi:phosphatidylglycerophosphate synthase
LGAKFNASVDFVFTTGVFLYLVIQGLYPAWILGLVVFMFVQFIVTSSFYRALYDPFGKYYGGFLYGAIGLTILPLGAALIGVIALLLADITGVSLISRLIYLVHR